MLDFVNSAKVLPDTLETTSANKVKPVLQYRYSSPGLKFSAFCLLTIFKICAFVITSSIRQPAITNKSHWSLSPLVCDARCLKVIFFPKSGTSGMYVLMSSSMDNFPSFSNSRMANTVNYNYLSIG